MVKLLLNDRLTMAQPLLKKDMDAKAAFNEKYRCPLCGEFKDPDKWAHDVCPTQLTVSSKQLTEQQGKEK